MAILTPLRLTLALFALAAALVAWRYSPPASAAADAPADRFSAARAREVQSALAGDGATRWAGTEGNRRGREAMAAALEKSGWKVATQRERSCTRYGVCVPVVNVVAELEGKEPALPGVLVSAHHDSVLAGPGASDDGVGTAAVVEAARAIAAGPRPRRNVVVLLSDGEELGLAGAEAFVRAHPLAEKVRATVNVDARGSGGPSQMFETSRGNAAIVSLMAEHLERPVTTSLFYEVYRRMPNDTDFSVTKTIAAGVNFANTARVEHYHTPLDDVAHADLGTLQHHGDHVLAMTRAFANGDVAARGDDDAVWFDVLALAIVRWPEGWSLLLALLSVAFVLRHTIRARIFDRGLAVFPAMLAFGGSAATALDAVMSGLKAYPSPWIAQPWAAIAAIELGAIGAGLFVARWLADKASPRTLWSGVWLGWALLGCVVAKVAPGGSYLFVVPALAAGVLGSAPFGVACVAPAVVAAVLVLALRVGLYDALGFTVAPLLALPPLLLATTLAPLLPATTKRAAPALGALAVAGALVAALLPKYSAEHPQRVNVELRQDEGGARVFVDTGWGAALWGPPPAAMLAAANATGATAQALPWMRAAPYADHPRVEAAPPVFEVASAVDDGGHHRIKGRVRSARGAPLVAFFFPKERHVEVKVDGRYAYTRAFGTGSLLAVVLAEGESVAVELDVSGSGAVAFELFDRTAGLPAGSKAEAVARARQPAQTPSQDGDVTVLSTKLTL
ncbi:MAG: M20/M25/M40 family metallo-hydrolase [Labilithrix sp.]|nr:M20/M25/M40 family metallo-hydrolase [Labilithrix sp.]MCW5809682.1 M20/M25/M40 family metallo-hydrolase [Labilithrix sp.]